MLFDPNASEKASFFQKRTLQHFCDYLDLSCQKLMKIVKENMNFKHEGTDKYLPPNI